ncbi:hypothetical protein ATCC90586_009075 [Pythium insidiosum]|nr:hypothetical protein ATCC90586_009075 [Pythium insidiosum]
MAKRGSKREQPTRAKKKAVSAPKKKAPRCAKCKKAFARPWCLARHLATAKPCDKAAVEARRNASKAKERARKMRYRVKKAEGMDAFDELFATLQFGPPLERSTPSSDVSADEESQSSDLGDNDVISLV